MIALPATPVIAAPASAHIASAAIQVRARGLKRARGYALTLAADATTSRLTACVARLATSRVSTTSPSFTVRIPRTLHCWENDSLSLGKIKTTPGRYHLIVAVPDGPSGFSGAATFIRRPIRITP